MKVLGLRISRDYVLLLLVIAACTLGLSAIYGLGILQFLINGLVVGSIYVLGATGLSLVYSVRKFANFAHGELMTFGAYMAFLANVTWTLDLIWGLLFAVVTTALVCMAMELLVFRRLANRGPVQALVASIGVALFLRNAIAAYFGTEIHTYNIRLVQDIVLYRISPTQFISINPLKGLLTLGASVGLILFLHLLLTRTTLGKAMRATADNADLARTSGINTRNVILWTWAVSGAMAAIAGVLLAYVLDIRTTLGFDVLLFLFAAAIIGGIGSPYGAMVGGFVVGIAEEVGVAFLAWIGRPDVLNIDQAIAYSPVIAFLVMIIVLIFRPEGLAAGKPTGMGAGPRRLRLPRFLSKGESG